VILAGVWCVLALDARADQVTLKNGDRLTGNIVKADEKTMLIKAELAGDVNVEWSAVTAIMSSQPLSLQLKSGQIVTGLLRADGGRSVAASETP
jgi:small nuclear ribonucleoprotein (snRNP)-like protein